MSITSSDVRQLVDQHPGIPRVGQEEIDRIVRILNAHRHPATSTASSASSEHQMRAGHDGPSPG